MTKDQQALLLKATASLEAARALHRDGFHGFAAARAYVDTVTYETAAVQIERATLFVEAAERWIGPIPAVAAEGEGEK